MTHERQFTIGYTYLTQDGKRVSIVEETEFRSPYYTSVKGDDGIWRWDSYRGAGIVCNNSSSPSNLVIGSKQ